MAKPKNNQHYKVGVLIIITGFVLLAVAAAWAAHRANNGYDGEAAQRVIIEQLEESRQTPSDDLADYLAKLDKESGCKESLNTVPLHELRIEYRDYAKIAYGCGSTDATMYLTKTSGQWQTISPTNNFVEGLPLCSHVKEHNIPKVLYSSGCFELNDNAKSHVVGRVIAP